MAKSAEFITPYGKIQTPCFMNVATAAAIKGALSSIDLKNINTQVALCITHITYILDTDILIHDLGGLNKFI
ncbi:hypothetical protein AN642_02855 [Epulopiscium sp. SCG-B10WGA-EpuloA2]|nr:hypothetical protein AN642_02855 [Epulopiscium sp. SCG-B10WGA-EpuloA2]